MTLLKTYIDEELGNNHWNVNTNKETFIKLLKHITSTTNLKSYYEIEISDPSLITLPDGLVVADLGAGNGWTSALLALRPEIKKVYAIEPSESRRRCINAVADHFNVPKNKIEIINGTFKNFKLPEKVNIFVMSSSFHHCFDEDMNYLFENIKNNIILSTKFSYYDYENNLIVVNFKGKILLASEHYVSSLFNLKHRLKFFLNKIIYYLNKKKFNDQIKYTKFNFTSGDHYRTKNEITNIFKKFNFKYNFFLHKGNVLKKNEKNKKNFFIKYYYAILEYK
jgi:SAM-dependent methyltransferase